MDIQSIPLFSMLRSRIGYLNQRQQLIAQNVANASTPGFMPSDLKPFKVDSGRTGGGSTLALTQVAHGASGSSTGMIALAGGSAPGPGLGGAKSYGAVAAPDDETKLDGNRVGLEDQMLKMNETRADYEAAVGLYQKAMSFIQMAAKVPGK